LIAPTRHVRQPKPRESQEGYQRFVESIPRWPPADIPPWVPAGAARYVRWVEGMRRPILPGDENPPMELVIVQRLATSPKMRYVWKELHRRGATDDALWRFVALACDNALRPGYVLTVKELEQGAKQFANVATACRNMIDRDHRVRTDRKLAAALTRVANYFESWFLEASRIESPHLVKHRTKDDQARSYARALGNETRNLFGTTLYTTVATTATVMLERPISPRQVRNWCDTNSCNVAPLPV
jgi:hypothetical protein